MRAVLKKTPGYAPLRNHEAMNPLMRKGGPHQKTRGAMRRVAKLRWQKEARGY